MKNTIRNTQYAILITLILTCLILPQTAQAAAPVANDQALITNEDTSINITLTTTDSDGDSLTYTIVTAPSHGSFTTNTPPNLVYKPTANYNGPDSFTFKANDGTTDSNIATISLTINPINDAPTVSSIPNPITFAIKPEETSVTKTYIIPVTDPENDPLTYSVIGLPLGASFNTQTGQITWTVTHQDIGSYPNVTFTASDGQLQFSKTVTLVVREAATYYCDPINGNTVTGDGSSGNPWGTLQSINEAGKLGTYKVEGIVKGGDTVKLRTGYHGDFSVYKLNQDDYPYRTDYLTIEADAGAVPDINKVGINRSNYWKLKGLRVHPVSYDPNTGMTYDIIKVYLCDYVWIEDCNIYTVTDDVSANWTIADWANIDKSGAVKHGINAENGGTNFTFHGNYVHNVGRGISAGGGTSYTLIEQNIVNNFMEDGMHIGGPYMTIQDNVITNVWADNEDWPHADAIQGAVSDGTGNIIRRNYVSACTDPTRDPNRVHGLQGFYSIGNMRNALIENNVIMSRNLIWGINLSYDSNNVKIINNTLIDPYGFGTQSGHNITVESTCHNIIIRNNIAKDVAASDPSRNIVSDHNYNINNYKPLVEFVDYVNGNVRLRAGSHFIDAGSSLDAPAEDLERNSRPQGQGYDVGAYEYGASTPPPSILYGDVNGDGEISAYDAALTAQYSVGLITLTPDQIRAADVSGNGEVSAYDAALIAQYSVGLISKFPVEN